MKRYTNALKRKKILEEFNKSGLSKDQFCREKKISKQTFYNWLRLEKQKENKIDFIPLGIEEPGAENSLLKNENKFLEKIILKTNTGFLLEVPSTISTSWLSSLLKELA